MQRADEVEPAPPIEPEPDRPGAGAVEPEPDARVDLLGVLAYGELTGSLRMSSDALRAPQIAVQESMARMAQQQFAHYEQLAARLREIGTDPVTAMEPFVPAFSAFHERTTPQDWAEGLIKAYVGDGIARDFYREVAARLGGQDRQLIEQVLADRGREDLVVGVLTDRFADEPRLAGRLALWGRRLVGEAIAQAQFVAVERDALAALIVGGNGMDLAELGRLFTRLTTTHADRMARLGLSS